MLPRKPFTKEEIKSILLERKKRDEEREEEERAEDAYIAEVRRKAEKEAMKSRDPEREAMVMLTLEEASLQNQLAREIEAVRTGIKEGLLAKSEAKQKKSAVKEEKPVKACVLESPRVHAFEYTRKHGISVDDEVKYFITVLKVLEHTNGEVEHSTRKGVYQLIVAHIDHPVIVDFMNSHPEFLEVLAQFLDIAVKNLDAEFFTVGRMTDDEKKEERLKGSEEECGLIMAAYGNFLGAPIKMSDNCLEKIFYLFPYMNRWKSLWNDLQFNSVKSLPYGVWANMARDATRCCVLCNMYQQEIRELINSFGKLRYHSDLKSLTYAINSISRMEVGRRAFFSDPATLEMLASYINMDVDACESDIRKYLMSTFMNIAMDFESHELFMNPESDLLAMVLRPICGFGSFDDDEVMQLPNLICSNIVADSALKRDTGLDIRHACLQFLWHLASNKKTRIFLREQGVYYLLRELDAWEHREKYVDSLYQRNPDYLRCLEAVVQLMIQTEEELEESGESLNLAVKTPDPEIGDTSRFLKPATD